MKLYLYIFILFPLFCCAGLASKVREVKIEVAIKGSTGGGSNNLNSISKNQDAGTITLASEGKVIEKIAHKYKIIEGKNGELFLLTSLTQKRDGEKDIVWERKIKIAVNKKTVENPFKGISLEILANIVEPLT